MLNIFNRKPKYFIRAGEHPDLDFALSLVVEGAKKGHYGRGMTISEVKESQQHLLVSSLQKKALYMPNEQGELSGPYGSSFLVLESEQGEQMGFALTLTDMNDIDKTTEILMVSIKPELRGHGHGRGFVKLLVDDMSLQVPLTARCYKKSSVMKVILEKLDFQVLQVTDAGTSHLYLMKN